MSPSDLKDVENIKFDGSGVILEVTVTEDLNEKEIKVEDSSGVRKKLVMDDNSITQFGKPEVGEDIVIRSPMKRDCNTLLMGSRSFIAKCYKFDNPAVAIQTKDEGQPSGSSRGKVEMKLERQIKVASLNYKKDGERIKTIKGTMEDSDPENDFTSKKGNQFKLSTIKIRDETGSAEITMFYGHAKKEERVNIGDVVKFQDVTIKTDQSKTNLPKLCFGAVKETHPIMSIISKDKVPAALSQFSLNKEDWNGQFIYVDKIESTNTTLHFERKPDIFGSVEFTKIVCENNLLVKPSSSKDNESFEDKVKQLFEKPQQIRIKRGHYIFLDRIRKMPTVIKTTQAFLKDTPKAQAKFEDDDDDNWMLSGDLEAFLQNKSGQ